MEGRGWGSAAGVLAGAGVASVSEWLGTASGVGGDDVLTPAPLPTHPFATRTKTSKAIKRIRRLMMPTPDNGLRAGFYRNGPLKEPSSPRASGPKLDI